MLFAAACMLDRVGAMTASLPPSSYFSTDGKTEWALESTTLPTCCSNYAAAGTQTWWPIVSANMTCSGGFSQTAQEWVDWAGPFVTHGLCLSDQGVDGFYRIVSPSPPRHATCHATRHGTHRASLHATSP